jgi:hypothetical protein
MKKSAAGKYQFNPAGAQYYGDSTVRASKTVITR